MTESEAVELHRRGMGNAVQYHTTRSYFLILRQNAFTFVNVVLFAISVVLVIIGRYGDALVTAGLVLLNVVVTVYQEARAKNKLEKIAILVRPQATVIRDGQEKSIDPSQVVLNDLLIARSGDQIIVDGQVVDSVRMEMDESLLTGESEPVLKKTGDPVFSGSYCVAGEAIYQAKKVGADSLINQLTAQARTIQPFKTPLQRDIDRIIRILVLLVTLISIMIGISFFLSGSSLVETMRMAAVLVALVPQGLFFMTTVACAMGAVRVAGKGALIQKANAVESTSYTNLLCLDKTGTLTTNRITFHDIRPASNALEVPETELKRLLGNFAASVPNGNRTLAALREAFSGQNLPIQEEVLFSSERRWSALSFKDSSYPGVYLLGAPEILTNDTKMHEESPQIADWIHQGLRVLVFSYKPQHTSLHDANGKPLLPDETIPLCFLSFREELRPEASQTLRHFSELGIGLKIISGDHPQAVAALARQAGMDGLLRTISGLDLDEMDDSQFEKAASETAIFGRITPQQKERLISFYKQKGRYVAMIGDGVNDVLSLKQAQLGIAMQSGSAATRGVADIVLLNDSFGALPLAFREGQRIVKGMEDVVRLLLTRTLYVLLLVVAARLIGVPFPVTPKHNAILALLTVGIPILAVAAWARPGASKGVIRSTSHFIYPAAFSIFVVSLTIYLVYWGTSGDALVARTALTTTSILCGLVLIPFVEPPIDALMGGDELSGDWRPTILALGMLGLFSLILFSPPLRVFFELVPLAWLDYLIITSAVCFWAILLRFIWRAHIFERFLGTEVGAKIG